MTARRLRVLLGLALVGVLAIACATVDRCGDWPPAPAQLLGLGRASGALKVGTAIVPVSLDFPATVAGYPPLRPTALAASTPIEARAMALEVEGQRVTLVQLDVLLVTARMQLAVAEGLNGRVWLTASHTHSSVGGYDRRLAAEFAALGPWSARDEARLVDAARRAALDAANRLGPAQLEVGEAHVADLVVPRSGHEVDDRMSVFRFTQQGTVLGQWLILSAHPTLVHGQTLDADWPQRLAARHPVTLVLQGAGGNASVNRDRATTPDAFAAAVDELVAHVPTTPVPEPVRLAWAEVGYGLPHPDGSTLSPMFHTAVEGVLCDDSEHDAMVSALRLGPLTLLFTTLEPSARAGALLEEQAHANRVLSLTNGYHGYLEPNDSAANNLGETQRQYFGRTFATTVSAAARLAGESVGAHDPTF